MVNRTDSSSRVLTFVLMVVFGILSGVIIYATWKGGSFDLRSKAASEEVVVKDWTFDSGNEGWNAQDVGSSAVKGGVYALAIGPSGEITKKQYSCTGTKKRGNEVCKNKTVTVQLDPRLENKAAGVLMQYPVNRLKIRVMGSDSGKPVPTCTLPPPCAYLKSPCKYMKEGANFCPVGREYEVGPLAKQAADSQFARRVPGSVAQMPLTVSYKLQGHKSAEPPLQISAVADSAYHEYTVDFPSTVSLQKLAELTVSFGSVRLRPGFNIGVDDISIIGVKESPATSQTFTGTVVAGESFAGGKAGSYYLDGHPNTVETSDPLAKQAYLVRGVRYLLVNSSTSPCPAGAFCKMIARPSIDFSQFVGKQVVATGTVSNGQAALESKQAPHPDQARILSVPTLTVTSMSLLDGSKPCQPIPTECTQSGGVTLCKVALSSGSRWCAPTPTPAPTSYNSCGPDGAFCIIGTCPQPTCEAGQPCPYRSCTPQRGVCQRGTCVAPIATPQPPQIVEKGCVVTGCNGELCVTEEQSQTMGVSSCVALPKYACYRSASCLKQTDGSCGWQQTPELQSCINNAQ